MIKLKHLIGESIPKNPRLGRCYELSGRYVSVHPKSVLVHGTLKNPFQKGLSVIEHAWIEIGDEIFDPVMDRTWPKNVYEDFFHAQPKKKYSHDDVNRITDKTGNWGPWNELKESLLENINKNHEKTALTAIRYVWRLMPKDERFYEYNFSLWMNNDQKTQEFISSLAKQLYPNDDEAIYTFFDKDIKPTLEKLEVIRNRKKEKKMVNDPLFLLKRPNRMGRVTDEMAESIFNRLYRLAMGQTMYDMRYTERTPKLSDLSTNHNNQEETLFIHSIMGWSAKKFTDKVKVYRGTNSPLAKIRPGDFVTFDKDYARTYMTTKFGTVHQDVLPSKDLRVYKMDANRDELIYWPEGHQINRVENVPSFKNFWEMWR